jgi:hypothetical protein
LEFCQHAVAAGGDDAPAFLRDIRVYGLAALLQDIERAFLVFAHQPAIADHIGRENCGQTAFDATRSNS